LKFDFIEIRQGWTCDQMQSGRKWPAAAEETLGTMLYLFNVVSFAVL
jgi:hypothetical protein